MNPKCNLVSGEPPIRIIETAGKPLEQTLVDTNQFNSNQCKDGKCLVNSSSDSNNNCRRNGVCYKFTCLVCLAAGKEGDLATCYFGESGKNMHCRSRKHVSKFNSKSVKYKKNLHMFKHLVSKHGGRDPNRSFYEYFKVEIMKAFRKPFTRCDEEGTLIANHQGETLNSKSEWHQAKVIRTNTLVVQGGAEVRRVQGGGQGGGRGGQGGRAGRGGGGQG